MKTKSNSSAFPLDPNIYIDEEGLTKREYFAAIALQGLSSDLQTGDTDKSIARLAVRLADALMAELNKEVQ